MSAGTIRLIASLAAAAGILLAAWLIKDRFHQKRLADAAALCAIAASSPDDAAPLSDCLPLVREEVEAARRGRVCERALTPQLRPETRFAMAQACSAGIKRLVAVGDAAQADAIAKARQLEEARAEINSAVERAERRTVRSSEREANGRKVIEAAPRAPGGSILCDADCLRRLGR